MQKLIALASVSELTQRGVDMAASSMLELGAGRGGYTQVFAKATSDLVASDIHRADVFDCELSYVPFELVDVTEPFPFEDNRFDLIFCSSVVEHIPDRSILYQECSRVLAPGGRALISYPPFWSLLMVGGHQYKPFHFLGERLAVLLTGRRLGMTIESYDHDYGEGGLYPLTIAGLQREFASNGLRVIDQWARMNRINTVRWPGILADLFTWHACFLVSPS